ncbi:hypothetical protein ACT048_20535 [Ectopseudomonas khazarica]|uniref:hypothetical protein n=1 Tax=Ectopseudomonas khazarica TaxID=2502979 RepID=UPI004034CE29
MITQDIYIRLVDPTGKRKPVVNHHRVWDRQRFITAQKALHEVKAKPDDKLIVEMATEADYRSFMGYKEQAA